jgi:hypothetical protein
MNSYRVCTPGGASAACDCKDDRPNITGPFQVEVDAPQAKIDVKQSEGRARDLMVA